MPRLTFKWVRTSDDPSTFPKWIEDLVNRERIRPDTDHCRFWVSNPDGSSSDCYMGDTVIYAVDGNQEYLGVDHTSSDGSSQLPKDFLDKVPLYPMADQNTRKAIDTLGHWLKVNLRTSSLDQFDRSRLRSLLRDLVDLKHWIIEGNGYKPMPTRPLDPPHDGPISDNDAINIPTPL